MSFETLASWRAELHAGEYTSWNIGARVSFAGVHAFGVM